MQRDFCLGSEWLYYKIYTGVKTSDYILLEKLKPVILKLERKKIIKQWFFIRYKDTDEHLRIRFLIKNTNNLVVVIQALHTVLNQLLQQNLIWKIQTDTYNREIERYGANTISDSEYLFWKDSKMILQYIKIKSSFKKQETPLLFSFLAVNSFLDSFQLSNQEKLSLMDDLQRSYKTEFETDTAQKKDLSKNYRMIYSQMKALLSDMPSNNYPEMHKIVNKKTIKTIKRSIQIKTKIEISLQNFLASHIHMMINRQYTSNQRMYELIIYDQLFRFYKSLNYR
ncbi:MULTISPECIES: thiopeptide-type bacteriocin biosynthesis protein [Flavobacterium]|uniref:Thiopeptide-type bacteriocin biosynthesis domain-containing protein n=1 Tax=Flavobacterium ginsengisoli TaxID=871694 RepID=A0ABP7ET74_9FLAO|nr:MULTISPECIES: thiopeptide-type bacteriocin biosynthesis protein [Flavobacterium]MBJ2123406.1 thiopeptide-type bacteriocin biosynthesis protein [Flavobacterium sp. IB48]